METKIQDFVGCDYQEFKDAIGIHDDSLVLPLWKDFKKYVELYPGEESEAFESWLCIQKDID